MKAERLGSAAAFLDATSALRAADPVLTNLAGSIATSVVGGRKYEAEFWWVVRDDAGTVVGLALRTAPYRLVVAPMPAAAATALGEALATEDPELPGVNGPAEVVKAVYAGLATPRPHRVSMRDLVYVLGSYVPPPAVPGSARVAALDDEDLVVEWTEQFHVDAGLPLVGDTRSSVRPRIEAGCLWFWEVDGSPVSMAGHAELVDTPSGAVGRIGPVFTPESLRRNGFGAAVTATVVEALLPRARTLMLFTDADNPTSNGVYVRLGFEQVARLIETLIS